MSERRLGELVEVLDHQRVPVNRAERANREGDIPYYGATGQVGWIDDFLFDEELVLLGEDGVPFLDPTKPKAYTVRGKSWVNNHAHVLRPLSNEIRAAYLCHALNAADYRGLVNGTTRLKLTKSAMLRLSLRVPSLHEQDRLVTLMDDQLTRVSIGAAEVERSEVGLIRFQASAIRAALSGSISGLDPTVQRSLVSANRLPLGDIASIQYGWTAKARDQPIGPRMLRITDIQAGRVAWATVPYCEIPDDRREQYLLHDGDILFARTGATTGKSYLVGEDVPEAVFASYLIRVRPDNRLLPEFLYLYFQGADYWAYIHQQSRGTGQPNVNGRILGSLAVPVPPREAQSAAVAAARQRLQAVFAVESDLANVAREADRLRYATLHKGIAGDLVLTSQISAA